MMEKGKTHIKTHKKGWLIGGLVGGLVLGTVAYFGVQQVYEPSATSSVMPEDEQAEAVSEFETTILDSPVSYADATDQFEELVPRLNKENKLRVLDLYMFELDSQLNRLSGVVPVIQEDLQAYDEDIETLVSDSFIDELPDTMVKGFLSEVSDSYFTLSKDDGGLYTVETDYAGFKEVYADNLSDDMSDYLTLAEHANEHTYYDSVAGHALFSELKDRLDLTRSLMDDDEIPAESQLMAEEYMTYQALLGIADMGMNTEEGEYNQEAIDAMEDVIDQSDDKILNQDMQTIIASMKEEGSYGSKTEEKALSIVEERFSDLLSNMEQELGNESGTDDSE